MTTPTTSPWAPVWALVERAGAQAAMVFITVLISAGAFTNDLAYKGGIAAAAALITVLANGVPGLVIPGGLSYPVDLALRVIRSFVSAFLAPLAAATVLPLDFATWKAAALGGAVVVLTLIKAELAKRYVGAETPALLPARFDVDAVVLAA